MLSSIKHMEGFTLGARDGEIGKVHSFLFDGKSWVVRYLVADTGKWLPGRKVLIAAAELGEPDRRNRVFRVNLTREQIRNAPDIDTDKPVSRQRELELYRYYDWAPYWGAGYGAMAATARPQMVGQTAVEEAAKGDPNLRSTREVAGYHIHAADGEIGHVEDFIVSNKDWVIRYLVVDTRNWLPGRHVLIPPEWVEDIDWEEREVRVGVTRQEVESSPPYDASAPVNREYEAQMYDYYGRPKYWE